MPVSGAQTWLVVPGLEPGTEYQFSVLAQNKLGTGPFSEVVTVNTAGGSHRCSTSDLIYFLDFFYSSSCSPLLYDLLTYLVSCVVFLYLNMSVQALGASRILLHVWAVLVGQRQRRRSC